MLPAAAMLARLLTASALTFAPGAPPPELVALFRQAGQAPPEIAAETLLRLASHPAWPADLKAAALQDAFAKAALAGERLPWKLAPGRPRYGPAFWKSKSYEYGLDRLTLQSRAVIGLARIEPESAARLFERMPYPTLRRLDCFDELTPEPDGYFRAALAVPGREQAGRLNRLAEQVRFPSELAPALRLLSAAGLSPEERHALESRIAAVFRTMQADDRSFSASLEAIEAAVAEAGGPLLQPAWRAYLARHLGQARCEDTASDHVYSERLAKRLGLAGSVAAPALLESPPDPEPESASPLDKAWRGLEREARERSPDWTAKIAAFEESLAEAADQPLYIRGPLLLRTAALLEAGSERTRLLQNLARWMNGGSLPGESGLLWLASCDHIFRTAATINPTLVSELAAILEREPNSALALWIRLGRLLPLSGRQPSR